MKRAFDVAVAGGLLILLGIPLVLTAVAVKITSPGPVLYWSDRIGRDNSVFKMPKFRSMRSDTPEVATHLLYESKAYLTPIGPFIRRTSLDELPQLWSVLVGHMSLVGPRPALFNQNDLIELRTEKGVDRLLPGITGWAQVNGRDDLSIPDKVALDEVYLRRHGFLFDLKIIWMTAQHALLGSGVHH